MSGNETRLSHDHQPEAPVARLRRLLLICSEAFGAEDFRRSDEAIDELVDLLDSVAESESLQTSEEVLLEFHRFVSSTSSKQTVVEAMGLAVPRVVVKFASVSDKCREVTESVIESLISVCSPRDMLPVLCEALYSTLKVSTILIHFVILLDGLSKVLSCIKRQHKQQVKVVLPVILNVLHIVLLDSDNKYEGSFSALVDLAVAVATSIQMICGKLEGKVKEELNAMLGLYVLQIMDFLSKSNVAKNVIDCSTLMMRFSCFLSSCGLSYIGLITGSDVAAIINMCSNEDNEDFMSSFSSVNEGAFLAVIWGYISREIAAAAGENLSHVVNNLKANRISRWQAINMMKHVLSSVDYPWMIKDHTIELLLNIMNELTCESNDEHGNGSSAFVRTYSCLQAIEKVVMYAPAASLRRKAFDALKKVISDVKCSQQFDLLKALIANSISPSMSALLVDVVKEKVRLAHQSMSMSNEIRHLDKESHSVQREWCLNAFELVELVLKPPTGPPSLPEQSETVLSALNLYRFILLIESTGKTNYSGALSNDNLRKAYHDWLLPLRTLVSRIEAEDGNDSCNGASILVCALNPVQLVLYRCIELVEDIQNRSK